MTRANASKIPAVLHGDQAVLIHTAVKRLRDRFGSVQSPTFVERLVVEWLDDLLELLTAIVRRQCPERPERLRGAPIGQYHCSYCGCMVLAGMAGHPHDQGCRLGLAPIETGV